MNLPWIYLGTKGYEEVFTHQEALRRSILSGHADSTLLLVEHPPTFSLGRGEKGENLVLPKNELIARGFDVFETNRGGKVTYHGPGQLVAYPVVDIRAIGAKGVKDFVCKLEASAIQALKMIGLVGERKNGYPGIWIENRKIASVGIHVRKNISIHGLSINVRPNLSHFHWITPCGIPNVCMTSIEKEGRQISMDDFIEMFLVAFELAFGCHLTNGAGFQKKKATAT